MIEIISLTFQIITSLATIAIAVIVYAHSRKVSQEQSKSTLMTMINSFNSLVLSNDKCLQVCDRLITGKNVPIDEAREKWAIFSLLNNRQLHYFAYIHGQKTKEYFESDTSQVLDPLISNDRVLEILKNGGYDPEFVNYCLERNEKIKGKEK